jgi:hypothetical protein
MSLDLIPSSSDTGQCCYSAAGTAQATQLTADFILTHRT